MSGEIIITDTASVKSSAVELEANAKQLDSVKESISTSLNTVKGAWEQSQTDAQSYISGIQKGIEHITEMIACNNEFSTAIQNYMEATEKTSSQTV